VLARHYLAGKEAKRPSSFSLTSEDLDGLAEKLRKLRPQIRSIQPKTGDVIADLKSGAVWLAPGVGEGGSAALREQGAPIDWIVPREGGVMWVECLAIPRSSSHLDPAKKAIQAIRSPTLLASLAWRKAYVSQAPSRTAYEHLAAERRAILRATNIEDVETL